MLRHCAFRRAWIWLLPAMLLTTSGPALGATVNVILRDGSSIVGNATGNVPVNGGVIVFPVGSRSLNISITNLGADSCPGGQIPAGVSCKTGTSIHWRVTTSTPLGSGISTELMTMSVQVPAELCECTSPLTITQCCQARIFVADGPAFGTQNHDLEYLPDPVEGPTLSPLGLVLMALSILAGAFFLRRRLWPRLP